MNEEYDFVLQRHRMLGIAETYAAGRDTNDWEISPLLCEPQSLLAGLPPILLHVGDTEVLLDDARTLAELAHLHGCEVVLKEWSGVVHSWHSFFPIMPQAEAALLHVVDFLRPYISEDEGGKNESSAANGSSADDVRLEAELAALGLDT